MSKFVPGDDVTVADPKFPGVWTVAKVNPKTYLLEQAGRRGLRAPHTMCDLYVPGDTTTVPPTYDPRGDLPMLYPGEIVRYSGTERKGLVNGALYVVLADKFEKVNVAKLGGDGGTYWRLTPRNLKRVDASEVIK